MFTNDKNLMYLINADLPCICAPGIDTIKINKNTKPAVSYKNPVQLEDGIQITTLKDVSVEEKIYTGYALISN